MLVQWSSTYIMLERAETQRKYINTFIYEMGLKEPNLEKRKKIVLDPNKKMNHFKKYWDKNLQQEALENAEHVEYYVCIHGDAEHIPVKKGCTFGIKVVRLLWELSNDNNNDNGDNTPTLYALSAATSSIDPQKPWLQDFNYYVNTFDQLAKNQSIVQWWGTDIAWDFLAIIMSSILSEQAFLSAALTITKCQNRLKEDVVEALQVIKCLLCHDLVFHEPGPSSLTEEPAKEEDELLKGDADEVVTVV
ncbi:hypothetical protein EV424DRAFT_1545914 [Suillus variegatus]|nr:hypothetical protein EV424DRAFT_1545914 [Suillus variegatus]